MNFLLKFLQHTENMRNSKTENDQFHILHYYAILKKNRKQLNSITNLNTKNVIYNNEYKNKII